MSVGVYHYDVRGASFGVVVCGLWCDCALLPPFTAWNRDV